MVFELCEDRECVKLFSNSQVTLTGSTNQNLKITISQERAFKKVFYVGSKTIDSTKWSSIPIDIEICGYETLTLAKPALFLKRMQKTGKIYLIEEKFATEFKNDNSNCPISRYELVYSDELM